MRRAILVPAFSRRRIRVSNVRYATESLAGHKTKVTEVAEMFAVPPAMIAVAQGHPS